MAESRVAIITGAGSGIGRAVALELAAAGWRCVLAGRRPERLLHTQSMMRDRGMADSLVVAADVAEPRAAQRIVDSTIERWGHGIHALVNNAAVLLAGPIHLATDELLQQSFEVNVFGPVRLVRSAWQEMSVTGRARIVNVSSLSTVDPFPGLGVYGMTKAALEGLTRAINVEGRTSGIRAFSLVLGAVETDMLRSFVSAEALPRECTRDPASVGRAIAGLVSGAGDSEARATITLE